MTAGDRPLTGYVPWHPSEMTHEANAALAAYIAANPGCGPHDPGMLMCLDKGDIVSRYQLLILAREHDLRDARAWHELEMRRFRATVGAAGRWWDHCITARLAGRKSVRIADMPTNRQE